MRAAESLSSQWKTTAIVMRNSQEASSWPEKELAGERFPSGREGFLASDFLASGLRAFGFSGVRDL